MNGGISSKDQTDRTGLDTSGRTQRPPAKSGGGASDLGKNPLHTKRRPGGAAAMVWAVEEEQEGVTAPFE